MSFPLNNGTMERKPRRYWESGKTSFVTSLPTNWIKDYAQKFSKKQIMMSQIGETLLVTPYKETPKEKPLTIEIKGNNGNKVYYSLLSAYIQGYEEVCLLEKEYDRILMEKISSLPSKLEGAAVAPKSEGEYKVIFANVERKIPQILDRMYEQYCTLYSKNKELFNGINKNENINTKYNFVQHTEREADKLGFLVKRLFSRVFDTVLYDPHVLIRTGLVKEKKKDEIDYSAVAKSVAYSVVAGSLERLTDIQVYIFEILKEVATNEKGRKSLGLGKEYGFDKYYNDANSMVEDAYNANDNLECLLKVLRFEDQEENGINYRDGYISAQKRGQILKLIEGNTKLTHLEGLVWANTGIATNISEAWINMSDLAQLNPIKK